jgi:hypothetical protein
LLNHDRISRLVAAWLAHPTGIFQALTTTALWFSIPLLAGWAWMAAVFWYLAYCTFVSFATQFTIAYQNAKAQQALNEALGRQERMAVGIDAAVATLIHLATNESAVQEALARQTDAIVAQTVVIADAVRGHSDELDLLLELARRTEELATRTAENERQQTLLLEGRTELLARVDATIAALAAGLAHAADERRKLDMRISDIAGGADTRPGA